MVKKIFCRNRSVILENVSHGCKNPARSALSISCGWLSFLFSAYFGTSYSGGGRGCGRADSWLLIFIHDI